MTEEDSTGRPDWPWDEMLQAFRALGGAAQNIRLGDERAGNGLFAIDRREPVLLRVPRNLLFRLDDIEFTDGRMGIRPSADIAEPERQYFERYENAFSLRARARTAAFIAALDELPKEIREVLGSEFGLGALLEGDLAERSQNHTLLNRGIPWRGGPVIAPVLEMASHGPGGLRYERGMHLQIQGYASDEIVLHHGAEDAYSTFLRFGVADRRAVAFSLSMRVQCEESELVITRNTYEGSARGRDRVPKVIVDGRVLALSYVMLGHRNIPRLPRGTLRTLLREAGMKDPDEVFDRIVRFNARKFITLLQALEPHESEMVSKLRTMARYQLEAMTYCIGSRELAPEPSQGVRG